MFFMGIIIDYGKGSDKEGNLDKYFSYFSSKTYLVNTH